MKHKIINKNNYQLHLIKTKRFKSIRICFKLMLPLIKEDITKNSLLCEMLCYSTKNFVTEKAINNHKMDLYGAKINAETNRVGKTCIFTFSISFLNPKYTEPNMLKESIDFIKEIVFNPNIENNKFNDDALFICKNYVKGNINSLKDDASDYAQYQMLNKMDKNMPYAYNMIGYLSDLDSITSSNLYHHYLKIINESIVDVYALGDFDYQQMEYLLGNETKFCNNPIGSINPLSYDNSKRKEQYFVEKTNNNQSKIAIGCRILNNNTKKMRYPLYLYNIIFGASSDSKLFNNVREKESYAYTISSYFKTFDSILIINCGINYQNYNQVVNLIKKEMQNMVNGNITNDEIESAKKTYINAVNLTYDSPNMIIENYYVEKYDYFDSAEKRIDNIKKVTKEDIMEFAKDVVIDTIFLLKEGDNNEKNTNK